MEWYEKFKVGQEVKVVKKIGFWGRKDGYGFGASWNSRYMDTTIGKVYKIMKVDKDTGYKLLTENDFPSDPFNYWYPAESLEAINVKGQQLMFEFMNE